MTDGGRRRRHRLRKLLWASIAAFAGWREGVLALVDISRLPFPARAAVRGARLIERPASIIAANRLAKALTRLGPSYVKLGQFLATRPDVVGPALARDLESLQDKMAPFPREAAAGGLRCYALRLSEQASVRLTLAEYRR